MKKMTLRPDRALTLDRETIRTLTELSLRDAVGAQPKRTITCDQGDCVSWDCTGTLC